MQTGTGGGQDSIPKAARLRNRKNKRDSTKPSCIVKKKEMKTTATLLKADRMATDSGNRNTQIKGALIMH